MSKGGGGSDTFPDKTVGGLSLSETDPNLSLASPRPRVRGHYRRRICLDRSRLRFPKLYGKRQEAPDWFTLAGKARHPSYRRGAFGVRPHKWCCRHDPGGARGLFFQITSSRLVRVRGRANWHQVRSFGYARGTFVPHRFVGRQRKGKAPGAEEESLASHGSELRSEVTIFRHSFSILFSGRFRPVLREDL